MGTQQHQHGYTIALAWELIRVLSCAHSKHQTPAPCTQAHKHHAHKHTSTQAPRTSASNNKKTPCTQTQHHTPTPSTMHTSTLTLRGSSRRHIGSGVGAKVRFTSRSINPDTHTYMHALVTATAASSWQRSNRLSARSFLIKAFSLARAENNQKKKKKRQNCDKYLMLTKCSFIIR